MGERVDGQTSSAGSRVIPQLIRSPGVRPLMNGNARKKKDSQRDNPRWLEKVT